MHSNNQHIEISPEIDKKYKYWRMRIFASIYLGYATFYFTRKSFTFAMPALIDDLGYSKADLGILASILYISYGISKFISGVLSDRTNPRYFMSIGLIFTGVANICFGNASSLMLFALFWGLNGFFQGWGFPPCTKQLTYWFSKKERGMWWSILSTANNLGGALIPLLSVFVLTSLGWRWAMHVPGLISIFIGIMLLASLRGVPTSLGLPPVEVYKGEPEEKVSEKPANQESALNSLLNHVLKSKAIWILAISCFCIYIVRSGINDWIVVYLNKHKGYRLVDAAASAFWFEVGGFIGCLGAGWGSDRLFQGQRIPYIIFCAIGLIACITCTWSLPGSTILVENILLSLSGFFIFGPQALIGLASAEFVSKEMACSAYGFTGGIAYLGAAASGYPLGKVIDIWGWEGFFSCLLGCCGALLLVLLPLLKQGSTSEESAQTISPEAELTAGAAKG